MSENEELVKALDELAKKHRNGISDGDKDKILLNDHRKKIKELCDMGIKLSYIHREICKHGFTGSKDKLAIWLENNNIRERAKRPRNKTKNKENVVG